MRSKRKWMAVAGLAAIVLTVVGGPPASAATGASTGTGTGTAVSGRDPSRTGTLGVTFGMPQDFLHGGPYSSSGTVYNTPMFRANVNDMPAFFDNYVEELADAGVDFVAPVLRGFTPGSVVPDGGGDPRLLGELVAAIKRRGVGDRLKIAAFDDTPASLTDAKNRAKHHTGGYDPPFDLGDTDGTGEGGYEYYWDRNLREFLAQVPDDMRYKMDGRPVVYEWSMNQPFITNPGNGNESRLLRYARQQAKTEFGTDLFYNLDQSWFTQDPSVVAQADGINNWFGVPAGRSLVTYQPIADDKVLTFPAGWTNPSTGLGDYGSTLHQTSTAGATVSYPFYGTGIDYLAETGPGLGTADVYLDNQPAAHVTLGTGTGVQVQQAVFSKTGLTDDLHTIKVVATGGTVNVDGFRVASPHTAATSGKSYGVATPGFNVVNATTNMVEDPRHGQALADNLEATVNAGANATLVEGFTDAEENALLARAAEGTYDQRHVDFPNQMIDGLRRYATDPFPATMTVEAESADAVTGATPGNDGTYRTGDLDVTRQASGWSVTQIQPNEALTWQAVGMEGTVDLSAKVAAPAGTTLRFTVDGVAGPLVTVPPTASTTVAGGEFVLVARSSHVVTVQFPGGQASFDSWSETQRTPPPPPPPPAGKSGQLVGYEGLCADLTGTARVGAALALNKCDGAATQQFTLGTDGTLWNGGFCADGGGNTMTRPVTLATCDGSDRQKFTVGANGNVVNVAAPSCLTDDHKVLTDGSAVRMYPCNGGDIGQQWLVPDGTSPQIKPQPAGPAGPITGVGGMCVGVTGDTATDAAGVALQKCDSGKPTQKWVPAADKSLWVAGKCATLWNGFVANSARVTLDSCDGSTAQQWTVNSFGGLVNGKSATCLLTPGNSTTDGTELQVYPCNSGATGQHWALPAATVPSGWNTVTSKSSGKCVTARTGTDGTAVQQAACNSTTTQQWQFQSLGNGVDRINSHLDATRSWDVLDRSTADAAPIQLWVATSTPGTNQQWTPVFETTNTYHFINKNSGKCLEVPGGSTADNVQLQQRTCDGSTRQSFSLTAA
ncbi:DUF5010 domain-containing protein [Actinoplanes sp. TBRC 11911]|uniref:DUF5010 domain-containing protein n=1 Tax=Actinoplanes sp. TBRC 11911 TaxID=2729386 RepID=UPI00145D4AD0|nr:DUF5010 domain-containing protein [Actinoplanes sp. TBRC 11911]NMO53397.1 DUF5010 domain-containing protein [Actinoplanes sp. TBRC 11911]